MGGWHLGIPQCIALPRDLCKECFAIKRQETLARISTKNLHNQQNLLGNGLLQYIANIGGFHKVPVQRTGDQLLPIVELHTI